MKVEVTITGILNLDKGDIRVLKEASAGEVMDTMRFQARGLKVTIETGRKPKKEAKKEPKAAKLEVKPEVTVFGAEPRPL